MTTMQAYFQRLTTAPEVYNPLDAALARLREADVSHIRAMDVGWDSWAVAPPTQPPV